MKHYSVYFHINPVKQEVFYVGIGNKDRPYTGTRSSYWRNTINKYGYDIVILHDNLTWEEACALEVKYIAQIGRRDKKLGTLVNQTDGGEGVQGLIRSDEYKKNKVIEQINYWTKDRRKLQSDRIKKTFKENNSGQKSLASRIKNNTLKRSEATKEKTSANSKKLWKDPEYVEKVMASRRKAIEEGRWYKTPKKYSDEERLSIKELHNKRKNEKRRTKINNMSKEDLYLKRKRKRENAKIRKNKK